VKQQAIVPVQISLATGNSPDATEAAAGTNFVYEINALPNTYVTRRSWLLAKTAFLEATKEEREMIKVARWNDFKVHYDYVHAQVGFGANILPDMVRVDGATPLQTTGWEASLIADRETGNEFSYGFFGPSTATYLGMYGQYELSMQASQASPDPIVSQADIPYADILSQVDPEDAAVLQDINETPPYDPQALQINEQTFKIGFMNASGSGSAFFLQSSTPFFYAPSGLIKITNTTGATISGGTIRVNCMHGKDRGFDLGGYN
jgi:hypothetical protein